VARRVLIVGAGIVGLSTAWWAAKKGLDVTVVDRATAAGGGCSFGNAGMVVPSHFVPLAAPGMLALGLRYMWSPESPFYVRPRLSGDLLSWGFRFWRAASAAGVSRAAPLLRDLHLASRACLEDWDTRWGGSFGLTRRGLLMLCRTARGLEEEAHLAERAHALGIAAEVLDAAGAAALEPSMRMDIAGAVRYPMDCHLVPERLMAELQRDVQAAGVTLAWETTLTGWRARGDRVDALVTSGGERTADEYVLCAGIWSTDLVHGLKLRIPMQAGKGYSLTLDTPKRLPSHCAILSEARVAMTPMGTSLRFGGTMELGGIDLRIDPARVRGIVRSVTQFFPDFSPEDFARVAPWCGLRPCSPDGLPYLGRFARYSNLSAATGHAMMGVSLGPVSGKLMAEMLCGERPSIDVSALRPDRHA
jgi:D-amino-acid dehydrogenase